MGAVPVLIRMEKTCRGCSAFLPLSEFYRHSRMGDGHLNYCKTCVKSRIAGHRLENLDKIQAYDRWRYRANQARQEQLASLYRSRTPLARKAHNATGNAIRDGRLVRPNACSQCGKTCKPEAHHPDYSKPFDVIWLCRSCHCRLHRLSA